MRFLRDSRQVIRRWWWIARGERQRVLDENHRLAERNDYLFKWNKEAAAAVHTLKVEHRGASIDTLRMIADRIDCSPGCEYVGPMDWSTGCSECPREDRGECDFQIAAELRDLAAALETHAKVTA